MHDREEGVIVKWEDLRVDKDSVYGKPVINMSHELAERTVDEIENGFLNAASVGHLVVLEYSDDNSLKLPGQTGPTVTRWFNRECSLVDIPGNMNALALYDEFENPIQLADFTKTKLATNMKQIFFTADQLGKMNLKADADEATVNAAFTDLVAKAAKAAELQTQLNDLKAEQSKTKNADYLSAALTAGKITKAMSDKLAVDYANNPEGLKNLLDAIPVYTPLDKQLRGETPPVGDEIMKLSWDDLHEKGLLQSLKANHPEVFKLKYKEAFGTDPV